VNLAFLIMKYSTKTQKHSNLVNKLKHLINGIE
jgi:hypothetical protein